MPRPSATPVRPAAADLSPADPSAQPRHRPGAARWLATAGCSLALLSLATPPLLGSARAQEAGASLSAPGGVFDAKGMQALIARGDAAAAAGNLAEARRNYDLARDASRRLLGFYRDLSGAFRGLDARIPREMDDKARLTLETMVQANMRLAALFRRQGQPEVAVPLLVEVVKVMAPTSDQGRKAYQQLLELGFVSTPWYGGTAPN